MFSIRMKNRVSKENVMNAIHASTAKESDITKLVEMRYSSRYIVIEDGAF